MSLVDVLRTQNSRSALLGPDNLIAIASGKGGVGKTFLAVTLSHALARAGHRVLLFDGDFGLANAHIHMGLMPPIDIVQSLLDRKGLASAIGNIEHLNFDFIPGRSGLGGLASLPRNALRALHHELISLAADYDFLVIDLGAGIDRVVLETINCAGKFIAIATQDPAALTDVYALIKAANRIRPHRDLLSIVNMADTEKSAQETFEMLRRACRRFLRVDPRFLGGVGRDERVNRSVHMQQPLLNSFPGSTAAKDIQQIMRRLVSG